MRNLEASPFYEGVELKVMKQKVQNKIKFHQFDLTCKTLSVKPDKKGRKTKKK
jgi:hypothetical protein